MRSNMAIVIQILLITTLEKALSLFSELPDFGSFFPKINLIISFNFYKCFSYKLNLS